MTKKRVVVALGHRALGTTLPEQKNATKRTAKIIADLVEAGAEVIITHSNAPQVGMIHTAMNEFGKVHPDYTAVPMSVCAAMSQGYIGYDVQNAIRAELLRRGIYKPVSTVLTQGTDTEQYLDHITTAQARQYMSEDQFEPSTMLPKIEASVNFVEKKKGRRAVITSIDKAKSAYLGKTGTIIE